MVQARQTVVFDGQEVPSSWRVGDFELDVAELTKGQWDKRASVLRGVAGKAWLSLPCARPPIHTGGLLEHPDLSRFTHAVEVVAEVLHPQTQISLVDAQRLRAGVALGETIDLDLTVDRDDLQGIVEVGRGVRDWLDTNPRAARFPVEFRDLTVSLETANQGLGRIVDGSVTYPVAGALRNTIEIAVDGFVLVISSLELSALRSVASAEVRLPATSARSFERSATPKARTSATRDAGENFATRG